MKPLLLLAVFLALPGARAPAHASQPSSRATAVATAEQEAIMDRIERDLRLPEGARPLAAYARFYAWQQREDGVRKVVAAYEDITGTPRGRRWVTETDFPLIMDGGCSVVTLSYDVTTRRIEHVTCNGDG